METTSTAGTDAENLEPQSVELARLMVELVRAGYTFTFQVVPNEWGAITDGEIIFERALRPEPVQTVEEDMEDLMAGNPPQAPIHWQFNLFDPLSVYKTIKRFHHLFVESRSEA